MHGYKTAPASEPSPSRYTCACYCHAAFSGRRRNAPLCPSVSPTMSSYQGSRYYAQRYDEARPPAGASSCPARGVKARSLPLAKFGAVFISGQLPGCLPSRGRREALRRQLKLLSLWEDASKSRPTSTSLPNNLSRERNGNRGNSSKCKCQTHGRPEHSGN